MIPAGPLIRGRKLDMNNRRSLIAAMALAASCLLGLSAAHGADGPSSKSGASAKHKVVIQLSEGDPKRWNLALNNARNLQDDVGRANVDIEIVTFGPGIGMVRFDSEVAERVAETVDRGIKIAVCENTMTAQKLTKSDMLPSLDYVKAGVTELMTKQEQG